MRVAVYDFARRRLRFKLIFWSESTREHSEFVFIITPMTDNRTIVEGMWRPSLLYKYIRIYIKKKNTARSKRHRHVRGGGRLLRGSTNLQFKIKSRTITPPARFTAVRRERFYFRCRFFLPNIVSVYGGDLLFFQFLFSPFAAVSRVLTFYEFHPYASDEDYLAAFLPLQYFNIATRILRANNKYTSTCVRLSLTRLENILITI